MKSLFPNPLERLLKKAIRYKRYRFLICWNRGLGDIALGLYALTYRIRACIPHAEITFLTRLDLAEGFTLLPHVTVKTDATWKRGVAIDLPASLARLHLDAEDFDIILEAPDPTRWLKWQLGTLTPKLRWNADWDPLANIVAIDKARPCVGVHVQTETQYGYEKNWPIDYWQTLFAALLQKNVQVLLFGLYPDSNFPGTIDLRGKTNLPEMLSLIKNVCSHLIVPDSGVLSLTYYLDVSFPLTIISLWADSAQGVLKQNVASPNPELIHHPLIAPGEDLRNISPSQVLPFFQ